jgi:hypothetical protein
MKGMDMEKAKDWGIKVVDKNCYSGPVKYFSSLGDGAFGKPDCAYLKGCPCGNFILKDRGSVCCYYGSDGMYRCSLLPSWVKNGFHEVKFYNGALHV